MIATTMSRRAAGFALPDRGTIGRDAMAGVVVGIIALPLSIALAVAVGVAPIAGLYTAVFAGATAAIFGGSRFNITGPTAALVPILSHAVLRHGPGALPMIGLMAGIMLLAMSALRFGRLVRFMPGPVIVGFTAGIALSLAFGQANNFLGVSGTDPGLEHFHERLWDTIRHLGSIGIPTLGVGLGALLLMLAWQRTLPRIPAVLITVVAATGVTWYFGVDTPTLSSRYGELPRSLPSPGLGFFDLSMTIALLPAAFSVAVLGAVESLLSAVVADGMASAEQRHNPTKELFGQGLANLVSPVMGGIPATAAIARTAAGIRNGAMTRLTGVFHSVTVLVATLALGSLAGHIPLTVLAAVLLVVAWNIAEAPEVAKLLRRAPRADVVVLVATILITLFFDLTYAIGFGVMASAVLLIRQLMSLPAAAKMLPDDAGMVGGVSPELSRMIHARPDVAFFNAGGFLSFHSASAFEYELQGENRPLILRMKDVRHIDTSGLLTLEGIIEHRHRHGARVILTAVKPELWPILARFGIFRLVGEGNVFEHTADAIADIPPPHHETRAPGADDDAAGGREWSESA